VVGSEKIIHLRKHACTEDGELGIGGKESNKAERFGVIFRDT
jgi:hypothetical protein